MTIQVLAEASDDPKFIEILNLLLRRILDELRPERMWIIQIDNWFDHKWLRFSGHGAVASAIPLDRYDTVKVAFREDSLTFPPFNPNRVLAQWSYVRTQNGYTEAALPALPHSTMKRASNDNLQRRVQSFDPSATFVWYSSNSQANGRASLMLYSLSDHREECWFAAFKHTGRWILDATKGIKREDVERLLMPS